MKKIYSLFALLMLCMNLSAQKWDFKTINATDLSNIKSDATMWKENTSTANRYGNVPVLDNVELTANGVVLNITKGMAFNAPAADKLRIDANKQIQINGTNIAFSIKNLKAGQIVKITFSSSSSTTERTLYPTNLSGTSGFTKANSKTQQTGTGTVTEDGDVTFNTADGGINLYSVEVTDANGNTSGDDNTDTPTGTLSSDNSVAHNATKNQAIIQTTDGQTKYYNTEALNDISINKTAGTVTVNGYGYSDIYTNLAGEIMFAKAAEQGQDGDVTENGITITESKGWLETAYAKWALVDGAKSYNVYVKGGQYTDYTKIDQQLVRNYGTYGRADIVGLKAGNYSLKVVAVDADGKEMSASAIASNLKVANYTREGFAHKNWTSGVGAYNNDGTLKSGAIVLYVTKNTAKTVTATLPTGTFTGIQAIIDGYQKKGYTFPPLAVRIIGTLENDDVDGFSSSAEGIQIKGAGADSEMNITIEGIGEDATIKGFGFLVRNCKSIEFRNLGIMRQMDDGISLDTDNSNIWIHNIDVYYGKHGGGDHAKGDGGIDVKADSKFVTLDNCHFWDTGKSSMCGMTSESGPNYITYHHNWFDHSDSRHARVRTMSVHMWNNYYDGVAKYGVGAAAKSDVFMENNYFRGTKYPMTIASQGHDIKTDGSSVLSGEDGGIVKAYGNVIIKDRSDFAFTTYADDNTNFDAYVASSRDEKVPSNVIAKKGGHTYNNFDTNASLMYTYNVDNAADVPGKVTGFYGAGRLNHGDCQYTFKNDIDDKDDTYNTTLASMLDNYKSSLVGIFGDENAQSGEQGQTGETGDDSGNTGSETTDPTESTIDGTLIVSFDGNKPSSDIVKLNTGNYSTSKGTATYAGKTFTTCIKMESATNISVNAAQKLNMTIVFGDSDSKANCKIDGTKIAAEGTNKFLTTQISAPVVITKADSCNIFAIIFEPVTE